MLAIRMHKRLSVPVVSHRSWHTHTHSRGVCTCVTGWSACKQRLIRVCPPLTTALLYRVVPLLSWSLTHTLPAVQLACRPAVQPAPWQWGPRMQPVWLPCSPPLRPCSRPSNSSAHAWLPSGERLAAGARCCSGSSCPWGDRPRTCGHVQHAPPRWRVCWVQVGKMACMPPPSRTDLCAFSSSPGVFAFKVVCICQTCPGPSSTPSCKAAAVCLVPAIAVTA